MSFPQYVNNEPPVISLQQYDGAEWAKATCISKEKGKYVTVLMEQNDKIISQFPKSDFAIIDRIFTSATKK